MFESATQQQPTPSAAPRSPIEKEPEEPKEATNGAATSSKRQVNYHIYQLVIRLMSHYDLRKQMILFKRVKLA